MKFFIASRWKNADKVQVLSGELTKRGHAVYSFLDNGGNSSTGQSVVDELQSFGAALADWEHNPEIKRIFDSEMKGLSECDALILLQPAGYSSSLEAGIAYGMGKEVMMIGPIEHPEVLYLICRRMYASLEMFLADFDAAKQ